MANDDLIAEWRRHFADQQSSGLPVRDWCARSGVSRNRYYYWRRRVSIPPPTAAPLDWLPITLQEETTDPPVTLRIGKVSIDLRSGFDRGLLCDVLDVLEARPC
jgi:hypothetical protein